MNDLLSKINRIRVAPASLSAWWLAGSGFLFKAPDGTQILIDPYLSDSVAGTFGAGRAVPIPLESANLRPDVVIATHWHEDHLDPQTIPVIARHSPQTRFVMPPSAKSRAAGWGLPFRRITALQWGETAQIGTVKIEAVPARHDAGIPGWETPDAMGVILKIGGVTIYHSGDSEYDARLRALKAQRPDAAFLCINGVTGNMNAHEAALLAWQIEARLVVPMHHLLWHKPEDAEATLDPKLLAQTYRKLGGAGRVVAPDVGEEIVICAP